MKISVVIPTRDRPVDLKRCLSSLEKQIIKPEEIIIVGEINDTETPRVLDNFKNSLNLRYFGYVGGTCKKRNFGVDVATGEIIVFLDDDTILPEDYFLQVKKIFQDDKIEIVTGYVFDRIDLIESRWLKQKDLRYVVEKAPNDAFFRMILSEISLNGLSNLTLFQRAVRRIIRFGKILFLWEGISKGKILPSGYRSEMPEFPMIDRLIPVEWLFGGNFAARKEIVTKYRFNERLEYNTYALNEDLEFSARIGKVCRIYLSPHMKLFHYRSPRGQRIDTGTRVLNLVIASYFISEIRGNKPAFLWATFGLLLYEIIRSLIDRNAFFELKEILAWLKKTLGERNNKES